jgi:hypothetical protein
LNEKKMTTAKTKIDPMDRRHPEHEAYIKWLRGLSMKERGDMIVRLCREAAEAERARIAAGLGPTPKEPWPESTWEHFRGWAAQARAATSEADAAGCNE